MCFMCQLFRIYFTFSNVCLVLYDLCCVGECKSFQNKTNTIVRLIWVFLYVYRYNDTLELEDAVHTAILTLKESFEGQMTEDNIELGICNHEGFRRLTPAEVKDYLASVQW